MRSSTKEIDKHSYMILDDNMVKVYGEKLIAFYLGMELMNGRTV